MDTAGWRATREPQIHLKSGVGARFYNLMTLKLKLKDVHHHLSCINQSMAQLKCLQCLCNAFTQVDVCQRLLMAQSDLKLKNEKDQVTNSECTKKKG